MTTNAERFMKLIAADTDLIGYKLINCADVYNAYALSCGLINPELVNSCDIDIHKATASYGDIYSALASSNSLGEYKKQCINTLTSMESDAFNRTINNLNGKIKLIHSNPLSVNAGIAGSIHTNTLLLSAVLGYRDIMQISNTSDIFNDLSLFSELWSCKILQPRHSMITNLSDNHRIELEKFNLHPPFDKCVYVFGTYAIVYTRKGSFGNIRIVGFDINKSGSLNKSELVYFVEYNVKLNASGSFVEMPSYTDSDSEKAMLCHAKYVDKSHDIRNNMKYIKGIYMIYNTLQNYINNIAGIEYSAHDMPDSIRNIYDIIKDIDLDNIVNDDIECSANNIVNILTIFVKPMIKAFVFSSLMSTCRSLRLTEDAVCVKLKSKNSPKTSKSKKSHVKELTYSNIFISPERIIEHGYSGDHGHGDCDVTMHIRRGHFKTYTKDRPLFGRYSGLVWIPPTVVGNRGTMKTTDYTISPTK